MSLALQGAPVGDDEAIDRFRRLTRKWKDDPVGFAYATFKYGPEGEKFELDEPQQRIMRAVAAGDRTAVRSCHGIGKTAAAAILTLWWLATRSPGLVVTMAGTWNHLEDKLWPEIHTWGALWSLRDAFEWQVLSVKSKLHPANWRAQPSSSNRAENVEGWHSPNLLLIIDEAKALPDEVYTAVRGALTQVSSKSGARPKVCVLSTPPMMPVGWYVDLFLTHAIGWDLIHVDAHQSTRVSQDYIDEMERDYGIDSPAYQSKVGGNIPESGMATVIQHSWFLAAQGRPPVFDGKPPVFTLDVARTGDDLTVLGKIHRQRYELLQWKQTTSVPECAGMIGGAARSWGKECWIVIDDTGVGGGVTDTLIEQKQKKKLPAHVHIEGIVFGQRAHRDERYSNRKAELWWGLRDVMRKGLLGMPTDKEIRDYHLPRDTNIVKQLIAPVYTEDSLSRIVVTDKRKKTERREEYRHLPTKSPDVAHTMILGIGRWLKLRASEFEPQTTQEHQQKRIHDSVRRRVKKREEKRRQGGRLPLS